MTKEQYVKLDEVTEILADVLCIPDFESRNILESDVSEAYDKILSLERVEIERDGVPLSEVLAEIREEIKALDEGITSYIHDDPWIYKREALEVIDKHISEEGDKE